MPGNSSLLGSAPYGAWGKASNSGPQSFAGVSDRVRDEFALDTCAGCHRHETATNHVMHLTDRRAMDQVDQDTLGSVPNGITFSPDYRRLYIVARGGVIVGDVTPGGTLANVMPFGNFTVDGIRCGPDGIRTDVYGNLWCSSNAGNNVGYSGVTVHSPEGKLLGRIRLPEVCANLTFGGPKRNRLFMAAGQSLYAVYVNTQGVKGG
jgi:sugar lactone lactonase YvrE